MHYFVLNEEIDMHIDGSCKEINQFNGCKHHC